MTTPPVQSDENPDDPNPGRSSATLAAFSGQVQRRVGLDTPSEAEVLVRATLNELGQAGELRGLRRTSRSACPRSCRPSCAPSARRTTRPAR